MDTNKNGLRRLIQVVEDNAWWVMPIALIVSIYIWFLVAIATTPR